MCVFMGSMIYLIDFGAQNRKSQANLASLQDEMAQAEKDIADGKVNVSNIEGYPNDYLPNSILSIRETRISRVGSRLMIPT